MKGSIQLRIRENRKYGNQFKSKINKRRWSIDNIKKLYKKTRFKTDFMQSKLKKLFLFKKYNK